MATAPKIAIVAPPSDLLERLRNIARELAPEKLPQFIGELEAVKATAWARLAAPPPQEHDELLDVATAAKRLGVGHDFLYRHSGEYPFTRRQGRKLLFSALGIDKHIRSQRA